MLFYSFTAARFEFLGEEGVFLTSVNEVENSRETYFHWLVKKLNSDGEVEDLGLIGSTSDSFIFHEQKKKKNSLK